MPSADVSPILPNPFDWSNLTFMVGSIEPGSTSLTAKDGHITANVQLEDPSLYYDCICAVLGYSYVDSALNLRRVPPLQHWFWLPCYATAINDLRGVLFDGTEVSLADSGPSDAAAYQYYRFVIEYEVLPFDPVPDSQLEGYEYERYTSYGGQPHIEFLERKSGSLVYQETWSGGPNLSQPVSFPGSYKTVVQKRLIEFNWYQVPEEFLADVDNWAITYPNLDPYVGSLNNATFLGCPAGTLLMLPYTSERRASPLKNANSYEQFFYVDVKFHFVFFMPPLGAASPHQQGHNNMPFLNQTDANVLYGFCSTGDNPSVSPFAGAPTYYTSTFANMFTAWNS
jgi:hypothetical protein